MGYGGGGGGGGAGGDGYGGGVGYRPYGEFYATTIFIDQTIHTFIYKRIALNFEFKVTMWTHLTE